MQRSARRSSGGFRRQIASGRIRRTVVAGRRSIADGEGPGFRRTQARADERWGATLAHATRPLEERSALADYADREIRRSAAANADHPVRHGPAPELCGQRADMAAAMRWRVRVRLTCALETDFGACCAKRQAAVGVAVAPAAPDLGCARLRQDPLRPVDDDLRPALRDRGQRALERPPRIGGEIDARALAVVGQQWRNTLGGKGRKQR